MRNKKYVLLISILVTSHSSSRQMWNIPTGLHIELMYFGVLRFHVEKNWHLSGLGSSPLWCQTTVYRVRIVLHSSYFREKSVAIRLLYYLVLQSIPWFKKVCLFIIQPRWPSLLKIYWNCCMPCKGRLRLQLMFIHFPGINCTPSCIRFYL
jgi:hypothetical protein